MAIHTKKESVELTLVYLSEGCGKTYDNNKRCDTPHLDSMGSIHTKVHSHIAIQEMSAVRCPVVKKTSTFSLKDSAKTLSNMYELGINHPNPIQM